MLLYQLWNEWKKWECHSLKFAALLPLKVGYCCFLLYYQLWGFDGTNLRHFEAYSKWQIKHEKWRYCVSFLVPQIPSFFNFGTLPKHWDRDWNNRSGYCSTRYFAHCIQYIHTKLLFHGSWHHQRPLWTTYIAIPCGSAVDINEIKWVQKWIGKYM